MPARLSGRVQPGRHRPARQGRRDRRLAQESGHRRLHLREGPQVRRARLRTRSAALSRRPQGPQGRGPVQARARGTKRSSSSPNDSQQAKADARRRVDPAVLLRRLERPADAGQHRRARSGAASARRGSRARVCAAPTGAANMALYGKMPSVTYQDYPEAQLIVLWGVNPSASGIHLVPYVREAQKRGAKLVVIDPRTTPLARAADVHLAGQARHRRRRRARDPSVPVRERPRRRGVPARAHARRRRSCASAPSRGRSSARPTSPASTPRRSSESRELYATSSPALDPLRLGPRAQPQRRQRRDGGARAAGGRRQVRRARRRLLDEQLGVVEHRAHVDRRAGAGHAHRQHESSRPRADRVRRPAGQRAVRLQLQSGGDGAGSAPRPARPRARGSLHGRLRAGDDRHGALRRRRAAGDDVPRGLRLREGVRPDQPRPRRGRSIDAVGEARSNADVFGELCARLGLLDGRRADRRARPAACRCSTRCRARSAPTCAPARCRRRRSAPAPVQFVDVFPEHAGSEGRSLPGRARRRARRWASIAFQPDPATDALSARAHLAGERAHDQLDARRAAAAGRQAARCIRTMRRRAGWRTAISCASSTSSARCTARCTVAPSIRPGTVSLPKGLWRRSTRNGVTGTALVPDTLTDLGGGACFNDARVQVASLPIA